MRTIITASTAWTAKRGHSWALGSPDPPLRCKHDADLAPRTSLNWCAVEDWPDMQRLDIYLATGPGGPPNWAPEDHPDAAAA